MANQGKNVMEIVQTKMQEEMQTLQNIQKQQNQVLTARHTLDSQLNENQLVKEELDGLEEGAKVFKLIGPVLVRQELGEARTNVDKRIQYINGELKRHDETMKDLEKKQNDARESVQSLQAQIPKLAQALNAAS